MTEARISVVVCPWNGRWPVIRWYMIAPSEKMSDRLSAGSQRTCSGGM